MYINIHNISDIRLSHLKLQEGTFINQGKGASCRHKASILVTVQEIGHGCCVCDNVITGEVYVVNDKYYCEQHFEVGEQLW